MIGYHTWLLPREHNSRMKCYRFEPVALNIIWSIKPLKVKNSTTLFEQWNQILKVALVGTFCRKNFYLLFGLVTWSASALKSSTKDFYLGRSYHVTNPKSSKFLLQKVLSNETFRIWFYCYADFSLFETLHQQRCENIRLVLLYRITSRNIRDKISL